MEKLLTIDEVCDVLRITRRGMYARRQRGQAPFPIKSGRRLLYRASDLAALVGGVQ